MEGEQFYDCNESATLENSARNQCKLQWQRRDKVKGQRGEGGRPGLAA